MLTLGVRAHDYGKAAPQVLCQAIAQDGWQTIQLAFKKAIDGVTDYHDITPALTETMRLALVQHHLTVGVLGVYVNPAHADEAVRRASVEEFLAGIPRAAALQAGCIGTETTNMAHQPAGTTRAEALAQLKKSLAEILPVAEQYGVTVGIEPVAYHSMATPRLTQEVLRDMQSKNLKVIFDPVNLFTTAAAKTQTALWDEAFSYFGGDIAAVHMKGVRVEKGVLVSTDFAHSCIDYAYIFAQLRTLRRRLPVLREEINPQYAKIDYAFLHALTEG